MNPRTPLGLDDAETYIYRNNCRLLADNQLNGNWSHAVVEQCRRENKLLDELAKERQQVERLQDAYYCTDCMPCEAHDPRYEHTHHDEHGSLLCDGCSCSMAKMVPHHVPDCPYDPKVVGTAEFTYDGTLTIKNKRREGIIHLGEEREDGK